MKRSELKKQIKEEIIEILSENSVETANPEELAAKTSALQAFNSELTKTRDIAQDLGGVEENEEPTTADLKKKDSVTTVGRKLQEVTKEMKNVLAKYKKSEGSEKEKHLERLKELTKIKKELESAL